jgi:predicted permease
MNSKNLFYILVCISFSLILGAGIYEHLAVWPIAYSEPPRSLTMFQGAYAIQSAHFWMPVHPLTLVLFIIALVLNRKTERKKYILVPLIIYAVVLVVTFSLFVPELISLTGTPYSNSFDPAIKQRGQLWINLSLVRMGLMLAAYVMLLQGLMKPAKQRD